MFIDRLLENWNKMVNQSYYGLNLLQLKNVALFGNNNLDNWDHVNKLIRNSISINCDNISDYAARLKNKIDGRTDMPNVRPIFENTWFEYKPSYPSGVNDVSIRKQGVLIWDMGKSLENNRMSINHAFTENEFGEIDYIGAVLIEYSELGTLIKCVPVTQTFGYLKGLTLDDQQNNMFCFFGIPLLTLSFLHCKNVTVQSIVPPLKLQKARERRGKLPLFTFKTLEIKPMTKILREEGESETKGLAHALHICRGHFKDFSQGSGLGRGHAHGLYWWDSQVRGNRQVGAVIKDYKVSPMGEKLE